MNNKKIYFLEGLPKSGKTKLLENFKKNGVKVIPEIINPKVLPKHHNKSDQTFFINNDNKKIEIAKKSHSNIIIIDRSPLSTLFFNLARVLIDKKADLFPVLKWFINKFAKKFKEDPSYYFLYIDIAPELSLKRQNKHINIKDPWSNFKCLEFIRNLYLFVGENYIKNFEIIDDNNVDIIFKKIISQFNKK